MSKSSKNGLYIQKIDQLPLHSEFPSWRASIGLNADGEVTCQEAAFFGYTVTPGIYPLLFTTDLFSFTARRGRGNPVANSSCNKAAGKACLPFSPWRMVFFLSSSFFLSLVFRCEMSVDLPKRDAPPLTLGPYLYCAVDFQP